ncbi:MAG: histidine--tRNA ligase [Deferribacteres bacterium]|nr:histidine--tRNA ligase [Deferribacteres bacterium]
METIQKIKGTHDILPDTSGDWRLLEKTIHRIMQRYGFQEIRTPIFEATNLFARGIGQLTDIVSKEMYTFEDRGKKSLTLKPEGTAPVIRAFIENSLGEKRPINKLYYISPMFRQENPQAGRFRQFHQFGAELIGSPEPFADVETILNVLDIYKSLGLSSFTIKLNSVGDENCREQYKNALRDYLRPRLSKLCKTCQERFESNPMRVFDCKEAGCIAETEAAPRMLDHLDQASADHFEKVCALLDQHQVAYELDYRLVRGLDYYTRTAYEVVSNALGSQNALGGGGRYDLLTQELGGKPTPAVGYAAGIERLLMVLREEKLLTDNSLSLDVFIASIGEKAQEWASKTARLLRDNEISADMDLLGRSLKAQMKEANRSNAKFALIVGEQELESGQLTLRNLQQSEQTEVNSADLVGAIRKHLDAKFK